MLKTFNISSFLLCLFLILPIYKNAWILFSQSSGYLPPYVYPVTLTAGTTVRGVLNWSTANDLDLYFYSTGVDLLSRSTFLTRQFSSSAKPEILTYTVATTGTYYLRPDVFSSSTVPNPYQLDIYKNGILT